MLLFDFGLAKLIPRAAGPDDAPVEMTGKTGSARYMAPEVALSRPYNEKADVHSFAMILYQVLRPALSTYLLGRPSFQGPPLRKRH